VSTDFADGLGKPKVAFFEPLKRLEHRCADGRCWHSSIYVDEFFVPMVFIPP
jgi:hypothetical protein